MNSPGWMAWASDKYPLSLVSWSVYMALFPLNALTTLTNVVRHDLRYPAWQRTWLMYPN